MNILFYYISGKKNQKIISEYILKHVNIMKNDILLKYEKNMPYKNNSLLKLLFKDNSNYNLSRKLIQTNN